MSNTFDLAAELASGVQDRHRAWEFIQGFAQAWLTPLRDEDGYSGEELNAAEERLGFKLPAALREAYTLFGKRADLCGTMNSLAAPLWNTAVLTTLGRVQDKEESAQLALHGELLEAEIPEVERRFARLGFPPLPIEESACTSEHRWYAGEDVIVRIDPYLPLTEEHEALSLWNRPRSRAGLIIRGRTPEIVDALHKALPTEWFHWEQDW